MKKNNLFLLFLMALIVMSCSKDETTMGIPQEGNAIEFGTYVGRDAQTRASVLDDAALKLSGFGVFAHYTAQDSYASASAKPNFMYNQEVTWGTTWGYTPVKYWPNNTDDKVSFFAYAPYSSTTTPNNISDFVPTSTNTGDPTLKFTVNDVVKSQADLVWGVKSGDGLPFLNQTKQTITEDIKFTFKHALARIGFNVEAMVDLVNDDATGTPDDGTTGNGAIATETKIVVTKVELIGSFYPSGTLNLNNTAANTPLWTPGTAAVRTFELTPTDNFETVADHGEATFTTNGQLVASATAKQKLNNDDSYIMVIPQNFASTDKIKIKVTYDVITEDTSLDTGQSKVTNAITSSDFNFNFEHGKAYTFNLHLGMTSVKFDAEVTDWDVVTPGAVVNVPINTGVNP
ncbi:MAG: fimbrillin family protein [Dysgonamonadaceae bacterium]|nr:fimbrillin family protein [Dysgonamonadaceae bacterium]